jgi:hypothetical protein
MHCQSDDALAMMRCCSDSHEPSHLVCVQDDWTPLHYAAGRVEEFRHGGEAEMVVFLLQAGANLAALDKVCDFKCTPLERTPHHATPPAQPPPMRCD